MKLANVKKSMAYAVLLLMMFTGWGISYTPYETYADTTSVTEGVECDSDVIPEKYSSVDKGYVTSVKNQGSYGTCWAFAPIACAETFLIKNMGYDANTTDLSELHLAYFSYYPVVDKIGGTFGDGALVPNGSYLNHGGNFYMAMNQLAKWSGVASESAAPYDGNIKDIKPDDSLAYEDVAHLQNVEIIPSSDRQEVKRKILEYGACGVSYYNSSSYMNNDVSYYNYLYETTNHAVTIVGWDDNYSRDNFKKSPDGDGAWLIKNTWGEKRGDLGYFWLSYYDKSLTDGYMWFFGFEDKDNYDNIYQYDGAISSALAWWYDKDGYVMGANAYTADSDEEVKAVSFFTYNKCPVTYSIQIYKRLASAGSPQSGTKVFDSEITGSVNYSGYHTVKLSSGVKVSKGERYSVVLTLKIDEGQGECAKLPLDYNEQGVAYAGQSYVYEEGKGWMDVVDDETGKLSNVKLKVFTDESPQDNKNEDEQGENGGNDSKNEADKTDTDKTGNDKTQSNVSTSVIKVPGKAKITKISNTSAKSNKITWAKVSEANGYYVYRKVSGGSYKKIKTTTSLSYTDKSVSTGKTYYYKVAAYTKSGKIILTGTKSDSKKVKVSLPATKITKVSKKSNKNKIKYTVTLKKVSYATGYKVYVSSSKNGKYKKVATTKGKKTASFYISSRQKKCYIKVRAYIKIGKSTIYSPYAKVIKK